MARNKHHIPAQTDIGEPELADIVVLKLQREGSKFIYAYGAERVDLDGIEVAGPGFRGGGEFTGNPLSDAFRDVLLARYIEQRGLLPGDPA